MADCHAWTRGEQQMHGSTAGSSRQRVARAALAVAAALVLAGPAAAQAPLLTTEDQLQGGTVPAAIEAFWRQRGQPGQISGQGGLALATQRFLQPDRATEKGAIVLVSGRTESMLKYKEVVYDLFRNGWSVYIHDHRGQGLSEREPEVRDAPQKGHVNRFDDYVADLDTWLSTQVLPAGHARRFLWAHSMGGAITARYLQSGRPSVAQVQAAVLSSPMLAVVGLVPGLSAELFSCNLLAHSAVALGAASNWHWGGGPYRPADVQDNKYSRSAVRSQRMVDQAEEAPATKLGSPTWGWVARSCDAAHAARSEAAAVQTPLLLMVAGGDRIVLNDGAASFCQRMAAAHPGAGCGGPDGGPVVIPGAEHELLIEGDARRSQAMGQALAFLAQHGR
ncbi:MAG: alpha/beta fold hydrolase [Pseudomonadota bacterium]